MARSAVARGHGFSILELDESSVDGVADYMETARQRILQAVRDGMLEAMKNLASDAVGQMAGAGIVEHSGQLAEAIERSPSVSETKEVIRGTVSSDVGAKHLGLWLEEGIHDPEVPAHLYEFTEPDGSTFYTRGHRAFDVKPHPFLNRALEGAQTMIADLIQQSVDDAIAELD
jgi:hypothetical protein